jgi:predicted amidohydrolase YtcJ
MCSAFSPGVAALARGALRNLAAPSFSPVGMPAGRSAVAARADAERTVILRGGPILTMDDARPVAEALAIQGSRILAVGSATDVKRHFTAATEIVDLRGRAVLPGFVEPHLHVLLSALARHWWLDLTPLAPPSRERVLAAVCEQARRGGRGGWVVGFGYDPSQLPPEYPQLDAHDLDEAAGQVPTLLVDQSSQLAYANHAALAAAGIQEDTPDPSTGGFGRDRDGRLDGVLHGAPAIQRCAHAAPRPTTAQLAELGARTLREFAARGCTTVYDACIGLLAGAADHELLQSLAHAPDAPLRLRGAFTPELADRLGTGPGAGDECYDVVGIKFSADGSTQGFAAAVAEPYLGGGHGSGRLNYGHEQLRESMRPWHRAGWQLVVHANGDRASEQVLDCMEELLASEAPTAVRHRIEHFTLASEEQTARAASLGLALSHTINHVYYWGESLRDRVLGPERAACIHALARDAEHGICSSCHSDSPVSPVDPLLCLRTATTRLMRDSDDVLGPFQQLELAQALRTVTCNPARQVLMEDRVGTLRPGMLADLVVLDRDPRSVAPERLHELLVAETWLGGRRQRWE